MSIKVEKKPTSSIIYLIDEENRVITAKIPWMSMWRSLQRDGMKRGLDWAAAYKYWSSCKYFIGVAKCAPQDTFNIEKGKELARARALQKFYTAKLKCFQAIADDLDKKLTICEDYMNYSWLSVDRYTKKEFEFYD